MMEFLSNNTAFPSHTVLFKLHKHIRTFSFKSNNSRMDLIVVDLTILGLYDTLLAEAQFCTSTLDPEKRADSGKEYPPSRF